jgi:multicomponent K+:H+ antiporter subunit D
VLTAFIILSGLSAMIAMMRAGIRTFWAPIEETVPRVRVIEIMPVAFLLILCVMLAVQGGPAMRYMDATAQSLHAPGSYISDVLSTRRLPGPKTEASQ